MELEQKFQTRDWLFQRAKEREQDSEVKTKSGGRVIQGKWKEDTAAQQRVQICQVPGVWPCRAGLQKHFRVRSRKFSHLGKIGIQPVTISETSKKI